MPSGAKLESGVSGMREHHLLFARAMFQHGNMIRAAMEAGSKDTAANVNSRAWMQREDVKAEIRRLENLPPDHTWINEQKLLREIARLGFSNIEDFLDEDGDMVENLRMVDRERLAAISKVKETTRSFGSDDNPITEKTRELTFHNKTTALDMAMKHLGMYEKDNNQKITAVQINLG